MLRHSFVDVHGIKRTLHTYAKKPLCIWDREIIMFHKYMEMNKVSGMDHTDTPSWAMWNEQGRDDRAIFVSNISLTTMQEELLEPLELIWRYKQIVMYMFFVLPPLKQVGCLRGVVIIGPGSKYAYLIYLNEGHVEEILNVHQ